MTHRSTTTTTRTHVDGVDGARDDACMSSAVPSGTVPFLFTDIEGSTRLWEERPEEMRAALAAHDAVVRNVIEAHGGYVFSTGGDGFAAAFHRAVDAVAAAQDAQVAIASSSAADLLRVRMGVHSGETHERDGDYFGPAVNRAARLMAAAHGGQVLVSATTAGIVGTASLVDLGEHRLRDLSGAQRVWQLGAGAFPRLRSVDESRANVPVQVTSFVGREQLVADLAGQVRDARLVTLCGVGGIGKTRLAVHTAATLLVECADGVWLCELAPVTDPDEVASQLATILRCPRRPGRAAIDDLTEHLATMSMLVVLDNCEHVVEAAAGLVDALITRTAGVRVLATSREPLGVMGERVVRVPSLATADATGDGSAGWDSPAVRLFVERSVDAGGRSPTGADLDVINEICRHVDGIPLAIELAAGRAGSMSPQDIVTRLDHRLQLLRGGRRVAVERHQTLRATLDWSYELLSQPEQLVLARLVVFAGSFGLDDVEAILGGPEHDGPERGRGDAADGLDVVDLLSQLVVKLLVVREPHGGPARYRLLETVREFAREKLGADAPRWYLRHARHFADLADELGPQVIRDGGAPALAALTTCRDDLLAALDHLVAAGDIRRACEMGLALRNWAMPFGPGLVYSRLDAAAVAKADVSSQLRVDVLGALALLATLTVGRQRSEELARTSIDLAAASGVDESPEAWWALACIADFDGDAGRAMEHHERTLAIAIRRGDAPTEALALIGVLTYTGATGDELEALGARCLDAGRRAGPIFEAPATGTYGFALRHSDPVRALQLLDRAIEISETVGPDNLVWGLHQRSTVRHASGDVSGAAADCRRGLGTSITQPLPVAAISELAALLLASAGGLDDAVAAMAAAQVLQHETGHGGRPWQRVHRAAATELVVQALGAAAFEARLAELRRQPVAELRRRVHDALGPIAADEARGSQP